MGNPGYVYVLINPSMPGLAKVGKTRRESGFRVEELSSATGVPSPFILAFQQPVPDCDAAEAWVHAELERAGHRLSSKREFFTAPLHEVVALVSKSVDVGVAFESDNCVESEGEPDLAEELYQLSIEKREGTDTSLPDEAAALQILRQAAELGHAPACGDLGDHFYSQDPSTARDAQTAINYYLKAVQLGHLWRNASVAMVFAKNGQAETAKLYWQAYFENAVDECELYGSAAVRFSHFYFFSVLEGEIDACISDSVIVQLKDAILESLRLYVDNLKAATDDESVLLWQFGKVEKASQYVLECSECHESTKWREEFVSAK